jgi:hypothetical protein
MPSGHQVKHKKIVNYENQMTQLPFKVKKRNSMF